MRTYVLFILALAFGPALVFSDTNFRQAWKQELAENEYFSKPPLITKNIVYFQLINQHAPFIRAVRIATGEVLWEKEVEPRASIVYHNGELLVQSQELYSYDAESGNLNYIVPLADEQKLNFGVGVTFSSIIALSSGQIQSINPKTLQLNWTMQANMSYQEPAINHRYIVNATERGVAIYSTKTGKLLADIDSGGYLVHSSPLLDHANGAVYSCFKEDNHRGAESLFAFDLETRKIKWIAPNEYGQPAVANNEIFIKSYLENQLDVLDAATGKIKWSWTPDDGGGFIRNFPSPVVTKELVFVSTTTKTYAISRKTREVAWQTDLVGDLALGHNLLLIGGSAFLLR